MNQLLKNLFVGLCLAITAPYALSADTTVQNPFFVFEDAMYHQTPEAQATLAKQIGFAGISFDGVPLLQERLKALDDQGLQFFYLYVGVEIQGKDIKYDTRTCGGHCPAQRTRRHRGG